MNEPAPQTFAFDHLAVVAITFLTAVVLIASRKKLREFFKDRALRVTTASVILLSGIANWIYLAAHGIKILPLQLCDLTIGLMAWALIQPNRRTVGEVAILWALSGGLQALLTPDLIFGFPHPLFFFFFINHAGVILAAVYLMTRGLVTLTWGSVGRGMLWINVYAGVIGIINWLAGTNFGYLAAKPSQPSLLVYMGPWPYYILSLEAVALGSFILLLGLSRLIER